MIATTQKAQQAENSGTQTVGGCPDTVFRSQEAEDINEAKPAEDSKTIDSAIQHESEKSAEELVEQAIADYWTL